MWQYSGWTRRGRFLGYSEVIREVRRRIMRSHGNDYFYLLTYAHHPALSDADAAAQLAAVVKPVTDRVRWVGGGGGDASLPPAPEKVQLLRPLSLAPRAGRRARAAVLPGAHQLGARGDV
jgi:hypothetical protein